MSFKGGILKFDVFEEVYMKLSQKTNVMVFGCKMWGNAEIVQNSFIKFPSHFCIRGNIENWLFSM